MTIDLITNLFFQFLELIRQHLLLLQIISVFISGILLGSIVYFIGHINFIGSEVDHYLDVVKIKNVDKRHSIQAWRLVKKNIRSNKEGDWKKAVLEADKILNDILKTSGYPGKSIDERLEKVNPTQLSNIEEIRQIHKLRHRIVFEPDLSISKTEAEVAIDIYQKALVELKLIEE